jgi:hypothetical protein
MNQTIDATCLHKTYSKLHLKLNTFFNVLATVYWLKKHPYPT